MLGTILGSTVAESSWVLPHQALNEVLKQVQCHSAPHQH